ncbi:hypothetical protein Tco_1491467 [Tanacetum coccineum]
MVAFLEKSTGSAGFHQVIDFLNRSHICYALTKKPDVYISFIKQFWRSAEATTDDNGEVQITATIDGHSMSITEASLRRHLKLDDQDGITSIPNSEIFEQLALMGYHTDSDKLTFQKGAFSPQWRFLIHNILHCLSPKKTAWEQFSSNIATAVICLATNRKYNFSRMIFEHMVSNISSPHKFFMYPRFIQICLDMQRKQLQQHSRTYPVPSLSIKVFNNMKRPTKGYSGQEVALFPTMLDVSEPSISPSRITSLPSNSPKPLPSHEPPIKHTHAPLFNHSPDHTTTAPTQPSPIQPSNGAEHHLSTPLDSPLHADQSYGSDEGNLKLNELMNLVTKLSERIGVLEDDLRKTKKTYSSAFTKLILRVKKLEARGRKLTDAEVQEKASTETEPFIQEVTPTEVIQDQGSSEKGSVEVSTTGATKGTASEVLVDEKRTRKDKGKAIMIESEPKKKSKKEIEQERLSFAEAIRLEEQMNEEQRAQIARDEEIARQWDEEERQRVMSEVKTSKKIDLNDPSVIRPIFEKVWDFNQHIEPMDMEHGSEKMKSPEKIEEEDVDTQKEMKEVVKESGAKRKKSLPRKRRTVKRQKLEEDAEKEELKGFLDIIPREDVARDVESLSIKYPIVDWKTYTLTENFMYSQIFRGDGSSKNYKLLSEMLEDFDRQDVEELYRLVKERYSASRLEGYDLMLWGDLDTLFEPDEEDEIWKNQHEYNVISWILYDFCGIHILLMQNGIAIHMLTEKKYPLSQEMISKMLKKKLECLIEDEDFIKRSRSTLGEEVDQYIEPTEFEIQEMIQQWWRVVVVDGGDGGSNGCLDPCCHQTQPSTGAEHHLSTPLDSPLHADHSYGSDEGNLKLNELMNLVTKLSQRIGVLEDDLRKTKKTYILLCTKPSKVKEVRVLESILGKQEKSISEKGVLKLLLGGWFFGATKGTASEVPVDEKRKRKDKGKAIMIESEPKKKSKKEIEQERLSFAEAIRLEEQMNEEQRAQIARDEEIARKWDEEERQRVMSEVKTSKKIDLNDPSVIRPIFEKVWDFNQHIEPMDMEHGSEKMKSPEKIEEEVVKESGAKRKKSFPKKDKGLGVGGREKWEKGGDGSSKNYKILSEMLEDFDRQDVEELYRLVKERYSASRPEIRNTLLSQEMISKMLKKKLEVDHESSQAFELLSTNGVSTASTYLVLPELVNTARRMINTADGQSC